MLEAACARAIADGATSCLVLDTESGETRATIDRGGLDGAAAVFELLLGGSPVTAIETERELLLVGARHASFACESPSKRCLVLLVAPSSLSVALGWSLLRRIATSAEATS